MGRGTGFRNGLTREDRLDLKGTFKRLCLPQCLPARTPGAENKEPAKPVDAFRHAAADAGSIPAVSIKPGRVLRYREGPARFFDETDQHL